MSEHARNGLLYGCLVEAYTFMKGDADMMNLYENRFQQEMAKIKKSKQKQRKKRRIQIRFVTNFVLKKGERNETNQEA